MEEELKLVFPTEEYKEEIMDLREEYLKNGESKINGGAGLEKANDINNWLKDVTEDRNREYPDHSNRYPASIYLAVRKEDGKIIGIIQIRHELYNFKLYSHGGHIGNSVRPTERNKGYGTKMISLALKKAKELGIGNVLMVCYKDNIASARSIIKNGGVLENEVERDSKIDQRYWISLKKRYSDGRNKMNDILEKEHKCHRFIEDDFKGDISLLTIKKVKKEWRIDEEKRCILADNYKWLQIYPEGKHYCITAMIDDKDNIVEWYFDIARELGNEDGIPYEDDLYLDVVIVPDGRIHLLDEDELEDAYNKKEVNKKDYDMAYKTANMIMEKAKEKDTVEKLTVFTKKYLNKLMTL